MKLSYQTMQYEMFSPNMQYNTLSFFCSYAFGIILWELYTGGEAHRDVPATLLGHQVRAVEILGCLFLSVRQNI